MPQIIYQLRQISPFDDGYSSDPTKQKQSTAGVPDNALQREHYLIIQCATLITIFTISSVRSVCIPVIYFESSKVAGSCLSFVNINVTSYFFQRSLCNRDHSKENSSHKL